MNDIGVQLYIDDVVNRDGDMKIVEAIVRLAFDLGKDLLVEGIETMEQREWLQNLGCKYEQAFLFSRPANSEEIEKIFLSA